MSIKTEVAVGVTRSTGSHPIVLALVGHLVGAALLWWIVSAPDPSIVHNDDFVQWAWAAGLLAVALVMVIGVRRRRWRSAVLASLGVGAALLVELTTVVVWIVGHSQ